MGGPDERTGGPDGRMIGRRTIPLILILSQDGQCSAHPELVEGRAEHCQTG